jgi:hypothetical protein
LLRGTGNIQNFQQAWDLLEKEYSSGAGNCARQKFEEIHLKYRNELTREDWKKFETEFLMLRNFAKDVTDADAYRVLRREIPKNFNEQIVREQERLSDGFHVVEVRNLPLADVRQVQNVLVQAVGHALNIVSIVNTGSQFEVQVGSVRDKNLLLSLNGRDLSTGQKIQVFPKDFQMTPLQIMNLMQKWLSQKDQAMEFKRRSAPPEKIQTPSWMRVTQISNECENGNVSSQNIHKSSQTKGEGAPPPERYPPVAVQKVENATSSAPTTTSNNQGVIRASCERCGRLGHVASQCYARLPDANQPPPLKILDPQPKGGEEKARGVGKTIFLARVFNNSKAKERVEEKERVRAPKAPRATPRFRGAGSV